MAITHTFTVSVSYDDMLAELPDSVLQRELQSRRDDPGRQVADGALEEGEIEVEIDEQELIQSLDDDTLDEIAAGRASADDKEGEGEDLTDTVKDIDRAVKSGDMMHYRILMNRLAPNAVIV